MEALPAMLQYTAGQVNMKVLMKVLAGQDFDPDQIIKEQKEAGAYGGNEQVTLGDNS